MKIERRPSIVAAGGGAAIVGAIFYFGQEAAKILVTNIGPRGAQVTLKIAETCVENCPKEVLAYAPEALIALGVLCAGGIVWRKVSGNRHHGASRPY